MEKVKFKAVELCHSVFGEISLGFFFIQDFNEFFKTFYETMQSSKYYFRLMYYPGELGKCIYKITNNNYRTVRELVQTSFGTGFDDCSVFNLIFFYNVSNNDIYFLEKILNETLSKIKMKIYQVRYSAVYSSNTVVIGSSLAVIKSKHNLQEELQIKEEITYSV